ncbi:hypothetical protein BTO06_11735 [Tenacibaculum sp. SZ-18]|uniref:hypothetical protein n=1 Tax=Tenacibaculum sp. SZ-18 TaxID=754423 RepID=UPI000C2D3BC8|nr:hypothetical protein [Tenacibaculum sp. SZ-18]AUC15778.1 hypothetical protein BTO06_11735 [Tenacibaculum sp. SZ-18]
MELIKIEISDIEKYNQERSKVFSDFLGFKKVLPFLIILIIGIILFMTGIYGEKDVEQRLYENGKEKITFVNYGIELGIGLGFILFSLLKCVDFWKTKNNISNSLNLRKQKFKNGVTFCKIEINKKEIRIKTDLFEKKTSWLYYDFFKTDNKFLSLYSYNSSKDFPEQLIPLDSLTVEEKELLRKYLRIRFINSSQQSV